jgi:hypothetical protein
MDADLDTICRLNGADGVTPGWRVTTRSWTARRRRVAAAPNGVATGNLNAGAVTGPKIAANAITWPNLLLDSYARIGRSLTGQSIPSATFTALVFDSIGINLGGMYNAGQPDRVTIQTAGFYVFGSGGAFATSGVGQNRMMQLSAGANLGQTSVRPSTTIPTDLTVASGNYLGAGTTLQVFVYQDSGGALQIATTSIWICRIS